VIERRRATHVVIDTDVASWLLDPRPLAHTETARQVIGRRARVVSFVTVAELRYGALRAGGGDLRRRQLERSIADLEVIQTSERLITRSAELRNVASRAGHPISQKIHEADRWVASTAAVLGLELVAGDDLREPPRSRHPPHPPRLTPRPRAPSLTVPGEREVRLEVSDIPRG
jgi:predicted nucleic acid-binding protein